MHTIQVSVRDKIATQTDDTVIINGNSDYNIEFDFDAEWANLNNKIGIFAYNDAEAHKWAYQTVLFSGNTCIVPILRDIHCVYVGVTAGNVRVTTPAKVQCRLSISDYADTEEPPSADIWGQILAKLDELQTEIDAVAATANEAVLYTPQKLDNLQKQQAQKNIGINPEGRNASMTNPVGVDGDGKLWSKSDTSLNVTGATVGQTVKVKAVDADGKPTAWEAVDMETCGTEVWEELTHFVSTADNPVNTVKQTFPAGAYKKIYIVGHIVLSGKNNPLIFIDSDHLGAPKVFASQAISGTFRVLVEAFGTGVAVHRTGRTPDNQFAWNGGWDTTTKNDIQMSNIAFVEMYSGNNNTPFAEGTDFTIYGVKA